MKKIVALLLVLMLMLSFSACSNKKDPEAVKEDLINGSWVQTEKRVSESTSFGNTTVSTRETKRSYTFSYDGTFSDYFCRLDNGRLTTDFTRTGNYTIKEDKIILSYDENVPDEFIYYSYKSGELTLTRKVDGNTITLVNK